MLSGLLPQLREYADKTNTPPLAAPLSEQQLKSVGDEVTKITHTARPMTISSGVIHEETGRMYDDVPQQGYRRWKNANRHWI